MTTRILLILTTLALLIVQSGPRAAASARDLATGRKVYRSQCALCHDNGINDAPILGDKAAWQGLTVEPSRIIRDHAAKDYIDPPTTKGGANASSALAYMLHEVQLLDRSGATWHLATGRDVYMNNCSTCHDAGQQGAPVIGGQTNWSSSAPDPQAIFKRHKTRGYLSGSLLGSGPALTVSELSAAVDYMLSWTQGGAITLP